MKDYMTYMERQSISQETHDRLLRLPETVCRRAPARSPWAGLAAVAACCLLAVGVWRAASGGGQLYTAADSMIPGVKDTYGPGETPPEDSGFVVEGADGERRMLPMIPYIHYQELSLDSAASIALPEGSFWMDLTQEQIQTIFWGAGGRPETEDSQTGSGGLPWTLSWEGYTLSGYGIYDGEGALFVLYLFGEHPSGSSFELSMAPGRLPPTCLASSGLETSDVFGTQVTGWSQAYDRNGDEVTDYVCGSEFMAGDVGVRFESVGAPFQMDEPMAAARQFNALFVRQALAADGGLYLDELLTCEDIPAWRTETFSTLAQARQEVEFAPYLPTEDISGYRDFYGRLSYQEGRENLLFVRWNRGYDDVEIDVYLDGAQNMNLVDVSNPASYDRRLYEIPLSETVPQEYQDSVWMPTFRAVDMSLEVVQARGSEKDTGGMSYRFGVLHDSGALVEYYCGGLTAQEVWKLVEPTL